MDGVIHKAIAAANIQFAGTIECISLRHHGGGKGATGTEDRHASREVPYDTTMKYPVRYLPDHEPSTQSEHRHEIMQEGEIRHHCQGCSPECQIEISFRSSLSREPPDRRKTDQPRRKNYLAPLYAK